MKKTIIAAMLCFMYTTANAQFEEINKASWVCYTTAFEKLSQNFSTIVLDSVRNTTSGVSKTAGGWQVLGSFSDVGGLHKFACYTDKGFVITSLKEIK